METLLVIHGSVAVAVVLFLLVGTGGYCGLVARSQAVDSQWAQVQSVYQRRADLVPNLVSTVSTAANFEKSTLKEVTQACASMGQIKPGSGNAPADPAQLADFQKAQDGLSSALSRLLVVAENYPSLKATENLRDSQAQLEGTENRIAVERRNFIAAVKSCDSAVQSFPGVNLAGMFGWATWDYTNDAVIGNGRKSPRISPRC